MTQYRFKKFCALAAATLAVPAMSSAKTQSLGNEAVSPKETKNIVEETKESCISGDIGLNITSQYVSRGVVFENQGAILQPYADLYFQLYQRDGFLNKIALNIGVWNSFNSKKTDAGAVSGTPGHSSTPGWYETDFTAGISFTFLKNLTITPSYYAFLSPNDGFSTFQGINTKLAYDDTDLLHAFALHPYAQILVELQNKAGTGPNEGVYYELGIAPSVPLGPVTLTIPVTAGFGSNNFYGQINPAGNVTEDGFGFVSAGLNLSYPLAFIPKSLGSWSINGGATYYYLNSVLANFNTEQTGGNVRNRSNNEVVFSGGLGVTF